MSDGNQDIKIAVLEERFKWIQTAMTQHHAITNDKLDKTLDKLTQINGRVGKAHDRIDDIEPHVEDYKANKKRAIIGLLGLGGATGLLGGKVGVWLTTIIGGS